MIGKENKAAFDNIDWIVVVLFLGMVGLGWINIYASAYKEEASSLFALSQNYGKQFLWITAALLIALVILLIDPKFFTAFTYPIYIIFIMLLAGVLVIGSVTKGAQSWYKIGEFGLQPTEFVKFASSLAIAKFLSDRNTHVGTSYSYFIISVILGIPMFLILLQPDVGSMLVYAAFLFVLYREGYVPGIVLWLILFIIVLFSFVMLVDKFIVIGVITLIAGFFYLVIRKRRKEIITLVSIFVICVGFVLSVNYIFYNVLEKHHQDRINILYGKQVDPRGAGYNVNQSKIAIGSGGFLGKGFLQGTQTKYDFVPEQTTDFIFCTVGEEWGFVGSLSVMLLFLALLLRLIIMAERQRSHFSRVYGYCVVSILFLHYLVNIGMVLGLLPVIGIPLPFFSYGGSSLWGFTILLFIFIKQDAHRLQLI